MSIDLLRTSECIFLFFRNKTPRVTITADQVPEGTDRMVSALEQRQLLTDVRMKTARPMLFDAKLSAERVFVQNCHRCCAVEAVIRCLDCVPLDMEYLCSTCDMEAHKRNVFHDREAVFHGFLEPIPPTTAVVVNENGQPQFCEQSMLKLLLYQIVSYL